MYQCAKLKDLRSQQSLHRHRNLGEIGTRRGPIRFDVLGRGAEAEAGTSFCHFYDKEGKYISSATRSRGEASCRDDEGMV